MAHPNDCRCTIGTISYDQVKDGMIFCKACGRIWDLTEHGWKPDPRPVAPQKTWPKRRKR